MFYKFTFYEFFSRRLQHSTFYECTFAQSTFYRPRFTIWRFRHAVTNLLYNSILWTCMFYKVHFCFTSAMFLRSFRFTIVTQTMFITVHVLPSTIYLSTFITFCTCSADFTQLSFCTVDALQAGMDFLGGGGAHPPLALARCRVSTLKDFFLFREIFAITRKKRKYKIKGNMKEILKNWRK